MRFEIKQDVSKVENPDQTSKQQIFEIKFSIFEDYFITDNNNHKYQSQSENNEQRSCIRQMGKQRDLLEKNVYQTKTHQDDGRIHPVIFGVFRGFVQNDKQSRKSNPESGNFQPIELFSKKQPGRQNRNE